MRDTVYIDILFLINIIVDCLIILSASLMVRKKAKPLRIILASVLGGIYSCFVFFINLGIILGNILTFLLIVLTTYIIFGFDSIKSFLKGFFALSAAVFIYGGITFCLYLFTDAGAVMAFSNGAIYIDIPIFVFLGFCILAYIVIWIITKIIAWYNPKEVIYDFKLILNNNETSIRGFVDTGNFLDDPLSGSPVVITEFNSVKDILPEKILPCFKLCLNITGLTDVITESGFEKKFRLINYKGVENGGMLPAFKPDKMYIKINNNYREVNNVVIAVTNKKISDTEDYTALLNPKILNI